MKHLLIAAALCIGTLGAQAQTSMTKPATPAHPAHNCMMATDKDWASLNLTADQTAKVQAIQKEHEMACTSKMKDDPNASKMMDAHEAKVKEVLTPAQYDSWMKWCAAQANTPAMHEQKEKM